MALVILACALCIYLLSSEPPILYVGLGYTFEQAADASTYPVVTSSDIPSKDVVGFGATWVKEPAVIIQFDDPQFGFSFPPTTFASIGYMHNKVDTITTSPMLERLSFERTLEEVTRLQGIFQAQGWQLDDDTNWFDLSPKGRATLRTNIRLGSHGYFKWVSQERAESTR